MAAVTRLEDVCTASNIGSWLLAPGLTGLTGLTGRSWVIMSEY